MKGNLTDNPVAGQVLLGQTDGTYVPQTMFGDATIAEDGQITVSGVGGAVNQIVAGENVTISPSEGVGVVTINAIGGGGGGVSSLNELTGALSITAGANVTVTPSGDNIEIASTGGGAGVESLNALTGALSITAGANVTVTPSGSDIEIASTGSAGVESLNALTGALSITAGANITVTPSGSDIEIASTGGGGGALVQLAQVSIVGVQTSIAFDDISGDYSTLKLILSGQSASPNQDSVYMQFNGDAATNYEWAVVYGGVNAVANSSNLGQHELAPGSMSGTANACGSSLEVTIPNYAGTHFWKAILAYCGSFQNSGGGMNVNMTTGIWANTEPITSIVLTLESGLAFAIGSVATLYGLQ